MSNATRTRRPDLAFVPGVDDPEEHFSEVYRIYQAPVEGYIRSQLNREHANVAEDLAADVFTTYWRVDISKSRPVRNAGGFLWNLARQRVYAFYAVKKNTRDTPYDLADPVNTPILAELGSGERAGIPELAGLAEELTAALETMTAASGQWKKACKVTLALRNGAGANPTPERLAKVKFREQQEAEAFEAFRAACQRVAEARAEYNRAEDALCR